MNDVRPATSNPSVRRSVPVGQAWAQRWQRMHSPDVTRRPALAYSATAMSIGQAREQAPQSSQPPPAGAILASEARLVKRRIAPLGHRYLQKARESRSRKARPIEAR